MSATIVWNTDWLSTSTQTINGFTSVVVTAGWRCTGTETANGKDYSNSIYGTCSFTEPPAGDPNFIPFASLTQAEVNNWVWASGVNQTATETAINSNLASQINPATIQPPLPWVTQGA